jgi:hypothetical protein
MKEKVPPNERAMRLCLRLECRVLLEKILPLPYSHSDIQVLQLRYSLVKIYAFRVLLAVASETCKPVFCKAC